MVPWLKNGYHSCYITSSVASHHEFQVKDTKIIVQVIFIGKMSKWDEHRGETPISNRKMYPQSFIDSLLGEFSDKYSVYSAKKASKSLLKMAESNKTKSI